ncbi:MAG: glutathione transferase GstA [Deltaproteobacteria bacterium]|nr:glutathione transferase GstA [Deltaproteobacteria bacterium]
MRLFYVPGVCSISPNIVLREAGIPFKLDRIDLKAGKLTQAGEKYLSINPKGYVPALELDDGSILTEGAVMVQYIADLKPEAKLAPRPGTMERVRLQEWLNFIATELHKNFSPMYQPWAPDTFKAEWREKKVAPRLAHLDKSVEGRPFLMGDTFTVADAYAFYVLRAWQGPALKQDLAAWPNLQAYYKRLSERPSVVAAVASEA